MKLGLPFFVLAAAAIAGVYGSPHLLISWRCMAALREVRALRTLPLSRCRGYRNLIPEPDENCGMIKFFPIFGATAPVER